VTIGQYGDISALTDRVVDLAEDPVLSDMSMLAGEQAAETKELIIWGAIKGGTNVAYSGTGTPAARTDVNDVLTLALQRNSIRSLKNQRGKMITKMVSASNLFATEAVSPAFIGFGHTDIEQDLRDMDGFTPVERYSNFQPVSDWEIGKVENVRYILTPVLEPFSGAGSGTANGMTTTSAAVDVYPVIICARNAYGAVALKGANSMNPFVINPDQRSKSDPLGQRGFVSWKMYFAALILNQSWLQRIEVGVTDLS
jgi:N4-gp56 family major capsid protein